jgi:hypothetical protein
MCNRANGFLRPAVLAAVALLFLASPALAYVGPTPGPEFFGYFMSLVGFLGVAFSALLLYPIHALRRRLFGKPTPPLDAVVAVPGVAVDGSSPRP